MRILFFCFVFGDVDTSENLLPIQCCKENSSLSSRRATREYPKWAEFAELPDFVEVGEAAGAGVDVLTATGGSGGSTTSLTSRAGAGASAGGPAPSTRPTREPGWTGSIA